MALSDQDWQSSKKTVLERNCYMFNNPFMSDVAFTCVESGKKFYAHKYVLATSSAVFYAMFYGDLAEKKSVIHLPDTDEETLEAFLRFLYMDECTTRSEIAFKLIYLAKKYMVAFLNEKCTGVIADNLNPDNVLSGLELAIQFNETELEKKCWDIIDLRTQITLESEAFVDINKDILRDLLKRDTLKISELRLIQAILKWTDNQCVLNKLDINSKNRRLLLGDVIYQLRFLLMSKIEFSQHVVPVGLLSDQEVAQILEKFEGLDSSELMWSNVKPRSYFLRAKCGRASLKFSRQGWLNDWTSWLSQKVDEDSGNNWRFKMSNTSYLRFEVDTPAMFHGLRLLGDADESEYEVAMEIEGVNQSINGKYTSAFEELSACASYGFDVMLPTPIFVKPREFVGVSVSVRKPQSYYVVDKVRNSKVGGILVNFEHQHTKRGDISEIILRLVAP